MSWFKTIFFFNLFSYSLFVQSEELKIQLNKLVTESHKPITYKNANTYLFTELDNHQGSVCSVYSPSFCILTSIVPSPKLMNIEHTWPQSEGANGNAKSDLHHLFPTSSSTNSMRSSLPFCDVKTIKWEADHSKRGLNEFGEHCFEPPQKHKGNIARAMFYFSIRYNQEINDHQETVFRQWNKEDPIDADELARNQLIKKYQNNSNPFIDRPELIDQINNF